MAVLIGRGLDHKILWSAICSITLTLLNTNFSLFLNLYSVFRVLPFYIHRVIGEHFKFYAPHLRCFLFYWEILNVYLSIITLDYKNEKFT